jgi:hypothetical protein
MWVYVGVRECVGEEEEEGGRSERVRSSECVLLAGDVAWRCSVQSARAVITGKVAVSAMHALVAESAYDWAWFSPSLLGPPISTFFYFEVRDTKNKKNHMNLPTQHRYKEMTHLYTPRKHTLPALVPNHHRQVQVFPDNKIRHT